MAYLSRFLKVLFSWLLAVLAASYLAPLILFTVATFTPHSVEPQSNNILNYIVISAYAGLIVMIQFIPIIVIPSAVFIFWAERKAPRYWFIYALAGMVIGAASTTYLMLSSAMAEFSDYVLFISTGAVSGFVAGLIYWCVAVKSLRFN